MEGNPNIPKPEDVKNINEELGYLEDQLLSIANILSDSVKTAIEDVRDGSDTVAEIFAKRVDKSIKDIAKGSEDILNTTFKLATGSAKVSDIQKQIVNNETRRSTIAANIDSLLDRGIIKTKKEAELRKGELNEAINKQNDLLEDQVKYGEKIQKNLGVTGGLLKGISKIPILGEFINSEKALAVAQAEAAKEGSSRFKVLGAAASSVGKSLIKNLGDPLTLISTLGAGLIKVLKQMDKDTEDLARSMNMSYNEAVDFRGELREAANASGDLFVTSKGLLETNKAINSALGTSVKLTDENVQQFTKLRTAAGLTNEELMGIQSLSLTNGKTLKENTGEILAQSKISGLRNGVLLNEKDILKGIKDVSAATTLSLGKNPGKIAEAVAVAKSLGMELSKIESISSSLLDFQSSIESELEAELLTGKQLNLETARQAALNNDIATLATEINKQIGTSAEFSQMNRIQQEAIAKSVGMSREDLAQTLFVQEQLKGASEDEAKKREEILNQRIQEVGLAQAQKELAEGGYEQLENQAGVATQFNQIVEKLKENFVLVGEAVLPIFNSIAGIVGFLAEIPGLIPGIVAGLAAMKAISSVLAIKQFAVASSEIFKSFSFIPGGLGIPLAIGAVGALAGLISSFNTADDLYSPGGGYGKRTLLAPEGAFALNDRDNIIATTNPIPVNDMISGPKGSVNVAPTTSASSRQEIKVAPADTKISLNLNGSALGNAVARQNYGVGNNINSLGGNVDYSAPI
jgi:hypothetical protein